MLLPNNDGLLLIVSVFVNNGGVAVVCVEIPHAQKSRPAASCQRLDARAWSWHGQAFNSGKRFMVFNLGSSLINFWQVSKIQLPELYRYRY